MLRMQKVWTGLSVVLLVVSLWFALKPITPDEEGWLDWLSFLTASDNSPSAPDRTGIGKPDLLGRSAWVLVDRECTS